MNSLVNAMEVGSQMLWISWKLMIINQNTRLKILKKQLKNIRFTLNENFKRNM